MSGAKAKENGSELAMKSQPVQPAVLPWLSHYEDLRSGVECSLSGSRQGQGSKVVTQELPLPVFGELCLAH